MQITKKLLDYIKNNVILVVLLLSLVILTAVTKTKVIMYYRFVDWKTIVALCDLLLITNGLQRSKVFGYAAKKIITRVSNERNLVIVLLVVTVVMSMLLTNDIALFIIIPLTLTIINYIEINSITIFILETIAANVGSLLTPFGNPQNIFLFHQWNVSLYMFVFYMLPLELSLVILLVLYTLFFTKRKTVVLKDNANGTIEINKKLLWISLVLFALFLVSLEFGFIFYSSPAILVVYIICCRKTILKVNWSLILIFILMFIDINLLFSFPGIENAFSYLSQDNMLVLYLSGIAISQVVSNVPSAIFLSHFSKNWLVIAYGVNIAGNGTIVSSLANLITLKLTNIKELRVKFHLYAIPFLVISSVIGYLLLLILAPILSNF